MAKQIDSIHESSRIREELWYKAELRAFVTSLALLSLQHHSESHKYKS